MWIYGSVFLVLIITFISSTTCCSPPQNYRPVGLIGKTILAPNIIIGKVEKIQSKGDPYIVPYSACVKVLRVLKNATQVPDTLCIGQFGGEELCLLHVELNHTYVMFLNRDFTARYDDLHGAAHPALKAVINQIEDAICTDHNDCELPTVYTGWKNKVIVKEGKDLELHCRPNGTIPYLISWFWNDKNLGIRVLTTTINKLHIQKVSNRWSGRFTCVVKSPAGKTSRSVQVEVDPIPCGGHILVEKGDSPYGLCSLNFPSIYPRDKSCTWKLCPPIGHALKIQFTDFAMIGGYDNVEITFECSENNTVQRILWGHFCRFSMPETVISSCTNNCITITHHARSNSMDRSYNPPSPPSSNFGFKAMLKPVQHVVIKRDYRKTFCAYDFIVKGKVKRNGIVSLVIEVMEMYLPAKGITPKELRFFYRYPLTDKRGCPILVEQGKIFIFLGVDGDAFYKLTDIYQENEVRHQWIMEWKRRDPFGTCY